MTIHSAKGLEFDYVYLIGLEEGLLPFGVDFDDGPDLEEERRLCYVAMTRARKGLVLSAAESRMLYGRTHNDRKISRFIKEAGSDRLEGLNEKRAPATRRTASPAKEAAPAGTYKVGTRVRHAKFGPGTVMYTAGSGAKLKARIRFNTGRTAMLMVNVAPLEILEGKGR